MKIITLIKSNFYEYLVIVRNAFILMFPMYLLSSIILFSAAIGDLLYSGTYTFLLKEMHTNLVQILPTVLALAISYFYVMKFNLPTIHVAVSVSIFYQIIIVILGDSGLMISYFLACIVPFVTIPIINFFYQKSWNRFNQNENLSKIVSESFKLAAPVIILTILILFIYALFIKFEGFMDINLSLQLPIYNKEAGEYIYAILNSLFWWIGFHGGMLLEGFPSYLAHSAGVSIIDINNVLHAFVFIGGSGSTLSLIIAIALFSRSKKERTIALSAFPFSLLNINEIILYGLPLIFNLRLLIPFIIAPIINIFIVNLAIGFELISISGYELTFSTFVLFNSWIGTNEGINGILLQLFILFVGVIIYSPFVAKEIAKEKVIEFSGLHAQFVDKAQEIIFKVDDSIKTQALVEAESRELVNNLERISKYKYMLFYQPQISSTTGKITGCEALIRAKDTNNKIVPPFDFLPWFHKANMNEDVDKWVLNEAYKQVRIFQEMELHIPISVNVTAKATQCKDFIATAVDIIKKSNGMLNIELTEELLADDSILDVLLAFKDAGSNNYVDDFGTGYSSLSYLYRLPVDAIKIDRSFVLALDDAKGRKLFDGLMLFGKRMGFKIVIEGVETQKQLDYLKGFGNEIFIQGWYYSKALDKDDFIAFVKNNLEGAS